MLKHCVTFRKTLQHFLTRLWQMACAKSQDTALTVVAGTISVDVRGRSFDRFCSHIPGRLRSGGNNDWAAV